MKRVLFLLMLLAGCRAASFSQRSFDVCMQVTRVIDGDTFEGHLFYRVEPERTGQSQGGGEMWVQQMALSRIRISGIDAPERGQFFGDVATCHLKWLVEGRKVGLEMSKVDAYGRWVAVVWSEGRDIGGEMLKEGLAWYREEYGQNREYLRLQSDAKMAGRGLWTDGDAIEPWKWRKMSKWERDAWR